jgi:hypothetical protein
MSHISSSKVGFGTLETFGCGILPLILKIKSEKTRNMWAWHTSINLQKIGFKEEVVLEL